jgi:hypothetical protein
VDLPVTIDSAAELQSLDFVINYDTSKLDITNAQVTLGSLLPAGWVPVPNVNDATGRIRMIAYSTDILSGGAGSLLNLHFTSLANASGSAAVNLSGMLNEGTPSMTAINGAIQIGQPLLPGDANADGKVDTLDFNILAFHFGGSNKTFSQGDFNYDTHVDSTDFNLFIANYGKRQSTPAPAMAMSTSPFGGGLIDELTDGDPAVAAELTG